LQRPFCVSWSHGGVVGFLNCKSSVMPPPLTREAARWAGAQAARQAASVYKAVVNGPAAPAPAGCGVEIPQFVQALPYLSSSQLVHCSNHFGQRGKAVGNLAAALAAEVSQRLRPQEGERKNDSASKQSLRPDEVTTVAYAFSKVSPQQEEYQLLYDAVGDGLVEGLWRLNRLQSALIATALADMDTRLSDALPALLQQQFAELVEDPQARDEITIDELRFTVHAAARLPSPGLAAKEIEALADCTQRHVAKGNFAKQAHLLVSWLKMVPAPAAKEAHFNALQACCRALQQHQRQHYPAHPLPRQGLAPFFADLLAREAEQNAPPLTPPIMQDLVNALVKMSRAVQFYQPGSSRSLSIDDWSQIMAMLAKYCEAHSIATQAPAASYQDTLTLVQPSKLPAWAAAALYHVLSSAQQQRIQRSSPTQWVQLSSLLTLLRLARRHKPKPPADPEFFSWAVRLVEVHQRAGKIDDGLMADIVGELVPQLPEAERSKLTRVIMARPRPEAAEAAGASSSLPFEPVREASKPMLLRGGEPNLQASIALAAPEPCQSLWEPSHSPAFTARLAAGGRLWGLLATPQMPQQERQTSQASLLARPASTESVPSVPEAAQIDLPTADMEESVSPSAAQQSAQNTGATVEELQRMLQSALQRVEALESRLSDQEQKVKAQDHCNEHDDEGHYHSAIGGEGWLGHILPPVAEQIQPSPAAATLHLSRAFNFEEFRRAHSARLDSERMRVIVPPNHFLWPTAKK